MNLNSELKNLTPGKSVIIVTDDKKYFSVAEKVLHYLTKNKKMSGVYISVSKPYEKVKNEINGVDWDKVLFLDAVSRGLKLKEQSGNCVYLQGPTSLTEMGICLTKATLTKEIRFLIVDSISSLLVYNPEKTALRFAQYIASKSKSFEMVGIVIINKADEEKTVMSAIKDMADKVIRI